MLFLKFSCLFSSLIYGCVTCSNVPYDCECYDDRVESNYHSLDWIGQDWQEFLYLIRRVAFELFVQAVRLHSSMKYLAFHDGSQALIVSEVPTSTILYWNFYKCDNSSISCLHLKPWWVVSWKLLFGPLCSCTQQIWLGLALMITGLQHCLYGHWRVWKLRSADYQWIIMVFNCWQTWFPLQCPSTFLSLYIRFLWV